MISLLSLHAFRYNRAGPGGILDYTIEHVRRGHRSFLVGNQQILAVCPVRVYHSEKARQVEIVQRGLRLVEYAERPRRIAPWMAQEDAEQEREGQQGPLPTREDAQRLPPPSPEPQPDLHPLLREIQDPRSFLHHPRHHLSKCLPNTLESLREANLNLPIYR